MTSGGNSLAVQRSESPKMFDELGLDSSRYGYPRRFNLLHGNTAKGVQRHWAILKVKRWMEPWFQVIYSRTALSSGGCRYRAQPSLTRLSELGRMSGPQPSGLECRDKLYIQMGFKMMRENQTDTWTDM